jgi:DNA-binding transcriptional LysR family regulator
LIEEGFDLALLIGSLNHSSLAARRLASVHFVLCASPRLNNMAPRESSTIYQCCMREIADPHRLSFRSQQNA